MFAANPAAALVHATAAYWLSSKTGQRPPIPLCPDLVVEPASPTDQPQALRREMVANIANLQAQPNQPTLPW